MDNKNKQKVVAMGITVAVAILLGGCAAPLSDDAQKVRVITSTPGGNCQFLKLIMENQRLGPDKANGAMRNAINATAAAGGNVFHIIESSSQWADGASIAGEALLCK
ncbi:MAG: hypothetical protein JWP38_3708 [Herbaspirillum sp.]|nr:hypothetical protein [Herbaspirillum sp.]